MGPASVGRDKAVLRCLPCGITRTPCHPQVAERSYVRLGLRRPVAWGSVFSMRSHSVIAAVCTFAGTALDAGVAGSAGVVRA